MTAFDKITTLFKEKAAGGCVSPKLFEPLLRELHAEHAALLESIEKGAQKLSAAAKKTEAVIEAGLKKPGL